MDCGPAHKTFRRLNVMHLLMIGTPFPVRDGIVANPEDYRWCGYGKAFSGSWNATMSRAGLGLMLSDAGAESPAPPDVRYLPRSIPPAGCLRQAASIPLRSGFCRRM
jgi:hypothetical protein